MSSNTAKPPSPQTIASPSTTQHLTGKASIASAMSGEAVRKVVTVAGKEPRVATDSTSEHPGYCGAQETFYVGKLKGVGRVYQKTFIDPYAVAPPSLTSP